MYNELEKRLIWLTAFDLPYKKEHNLLEYVGDISNLFESFNDKEVKEILGNDLYEEMNKLCDDNFLNAYLLGLDKMGIDCLTIESDNYPQKLREIDEPPFVLFCKGDLSLLDKKALAVVGTRKPTNYGRVITEKFIKEIASYDVAIISGLAYGVDTIAHRATLDVKGKTITVLGGGFSHVYPSSNNGLLNEIIENGLAISEYKPSTRPTKYTFPFRNRIIAGLSDGVFIPEASEKSGSLHTKNYALNYGKDIFCLPGNINSSSSEGTNRILKFGQAHFVTDCSDITSVLNIKTQEKAHNFQLSIDETFIVKCLQDGEKDFASIAENTGLSINILNSCLTTLEIRGIIKKLPGNIFSL